MVTDGSKFSIKKNPLGFPRGLILVELGGIEPPTS